MVAYLVLEMHETLPTVATHVNNWIGASYVLTVLGAFLSDAYVGRLMTIVIFSCIYIVGMILLTLSASIASLRPPKCMAMPCIKATEKRTGFLSFALALMALGTGGIKPCISSFGADQFDESNKKEARQKYAFFNWFFFAINMGAILGITVIVHIEEKKGYAWGFGLLTISNVFSIIILAVGLRFYCYQKPMGSPFTRFLQVLLAAIRNSDGFQLKPRAVLYEDDLKEFDITGAQKLAH